MADPIHVYIGTYTTEEAAKADLDAVRDLYNDGVLRTYDAAVVAKETGGHIHVRRHEHTTTQSAVRGAAVGALVGVLFPPVFIASTVAGAGVAGVVSHLWHGMSRGDLKTLGESLDAGEASLVVISTTEFDHAFTAALQAMSHEIVVLDKADAKAFAEAVEGISED